MADEQGQQEKKQEGQSQEDGQQQGGQGEQRNDSQQQGNQGEQKKEGGERQESGGGQKRQDPRRKRNIRFILLAVLVVAVIASIPIFMYYSVRESTDDAQVDGHLIPISPRISGYVLEVLVNDNQKVKVGESLVKLDPADYQTAYESAEAQLESLLATSTESKVNVPLTDINTRGSLNITTTQEQQAIAAVNGANQAVSAARARLNSSSAALMQTQANFIRAQKDLARTKALVEKDEISKQDYDAAVAAADANAAQVEAARADVVTSQHTLDQSIAQVDQAKASLATAVVQRRQNTESKPRQIEISKARYNQSQATAKQQRASVEQAKLNLGYTLIKAPVDGVVSRKTAEPGMQVSPGQQIMSLVPLDDIWVTANFKETQLKKMRPRQEVEIEVDTYGSSRSYRGHVDSIAAASGARFQLLPPENATGNYVKVVQRIPVKIVLEPGQNRDYHLVPGMSVVPTVMLNTDVDRDKK